MQNIKTEAIAPILENNHRTKSWTSDELERIQSELDRANSRMKAANTLAERSEQLSQQLLELSPIPLNDVAQVRQEIEYCIKLISACLISGTFEAIEVNLVAKIQENPEAFHLSTEDFIAVFNCFKENHALTDEAGNAANEYIEGAIGALTELGTSQLKIPETSENLTLEEIQEKYPQQWVMIAYTERDEYLNVIRGEVLAYSPDCDEIEDYLPNRKGKAVAIEYTGPIPEEIGIWM